MATTPEQPAAPTVPTKVCPHCGVQSQTMADKCPSCGKSYKTKTKKRGGCLKVLGGIIGLIILIAIIASVTSGKKDSGGKSATTSNGGGGAPSAQGTDNGPLVTGTWNGECNQFSGGDQDACKALRVSKVTCQWVGDSVRMTVAFHNRFGAHVTVHVEPKYRIKNGGTHGEGITNVEDVGLDSGETRTWDKDLKPAGISGHPAITACIPGVDVLQGVELG